MHISNNTNLLGQTFSCFAFPISKDLSFYEQSLNPPVLVFVQNKERAKELYDEVKFDDIRADVIHSDLSQIQVIFCKFLILKVSRLTGQNASSHF